ncbi:unnamed protein product [Paramecium primaurelia]|uniref:Uncharacterized protein n=1 Tax=Paramecium primaurelia TaxID=5886 RepID=A0A8S1LDQ1_PARPR|nr:unnamed protein product [Paramecium primaurelia]
MLQQQTQGGQGPLWQTVPQDFVLPKPKFEATVTKLGKKQHERHLVITEKHILLFKDKSKHVHKLLPLDFTTRFEIFRDAPVLKANASQKKSTPNTPHSNRVDIVKPEDVQTLGDILHIRLQSEKTEKKKNIGTSLVIKKFQKHFENILGKKSIRWDSIICSKFLKRQEKETLQVFIQLKELRMDNKWQSRHFQKVQFMLKRMERKVQLMKQQQ